MSFKPQEAKVWRRLLGQAKAMVTAHCKTPLKERMRGLCLKRNDCKCEMWTDVYEGYEKLWEALEITADDHMPDLALQMVTQGYFSAKHPPTGLEKAKGELMSR